jgi:hypothetical protein
MIRSERQPRYKTQVNVEATRREDRVRRGIRVLQRQMLQKRYKITHSNSMKDDSSGMPPTKQAAGVPEKMTLDPSVEEADVFTVKECRIHS